VELLDSQDPEFRGRAAQTIGEIGPEAKDAVPRLILLCGDSDRLVRRVAIVALGGIGPSAQSAVTALIRLLDDHEVEIRELAASSLGAIGPASKDALPKLISLLESKEEKDRCAASLALGRIGPNASPAVLPLSELLKAPQDCVRKNAAYALINLGPQVKLAIPNLILVLQDSDAEVRKYSAQALGKLGIEARGALSPLISVINDSDHEVRESVAESLVSISASLAEAKSNESISQLREAHKALKDSPYAEVQSRAERVGKAIDSLDGMYSQRIIQWTRDHSYLATALALALWFPFALLVCSLLLWLRPLWVFRINELIPNSLNLKLVERMIDVRFPLKFILVVGFFHYHPRVLDAWVSNHIDTVREEFERLDTVRSRSVHVDAPVIFEGKSLPALSPNTLYPAFSRNRIFLLITGEGGSGKTSLACQIARWAMSENKSERLAPHLMIPILLDQDVRHRSLGNSASAFTELIRGGLQVLLGQAKAPGIELTERLLHTKRVLIIADHLSEMNDATRQLINPALVDFPASALVVTSRLEEPLDGVPKITINPLRIEGKRLSSFMEAYLVQKGKRHLFNDSEFFDACSRLSILVGERDITVLLATFYADQMVVSKESDNGSKPPDNIPDLMLGYIMKANNNVGPDSLASNIVINAAKQIAWECLKSTYQPTSIDFADACGVLDGEKYGSKVIGYLEHKINILQKSRAVEGYVRFVLDPLAEYLAALHVIDLYGNNDDKWRTFIAQAERLTDETQSVIEFLLAVRDCCLARNSTNHTPNWLPHQLGQMAGLGPNAFVKN
jgi:HEAT repeat protein